MAKEKSKTARTENLQTRALFDPASFNEAERTVDVIFATETSEVKRYDWNNDVIFIEQLVCTPEAVRLGRLNAGAPLLDNHKQWDGVKGVLGVVEKAVISGGQGRATIRFSQRDDVKPVMNDVKDGILRSISVGYNVKKYEKQPVIEGETPIYRAIDWEPAEISLAVIPADIDSGVRSAESKLKAVNETEIIEIENKNLNTTTNNRTMETEKLKNTEKEVTTTVVDEKAIRTAADAAVSAERTRVSEITLAVRAAGLDSSFVEQFIADGTGVDEVRKAVITELGKKEPKTVAVDASVLKDASDKRVAGMEIGILHRANPSALTDKETPGEYRGMSLLDMARESLAAQGVSVRGMSAREIASGALNGTRGAHSISDFPIILGNTINRSLRSAYALAPKTFEPFTRKTTAKDFRPMTRTQLGDISAFKKVVEGGEYKYATMGEAKEAYAVAKYGEIIALTWEAIVNDDLNAFARIPQSMAEQAVQKQSDIVWAIITGNPALNDTVDLFHATHTNLTGTGTVINVANLGIGRKLMRKQKSIGGSYLNLEPTYLIVAPELEDVANQYTSANFVASQASNINNPKNTSLKVIVEPRLSALNSGLSWFLAAEPSRIDTIEYAFLEGEGELFTEQRLGFGVDGLETKVRMVFGAAPIDFRGLYKNVGA